MAHISETQSRALHTPIPARDLDLHIGPGDTLAVADRSSPARWASS
jgi:hypothetical protein